MKEKIFFIVLAFAFAGTNNYSDVYPNDPVQEALQYLTEEGVVEGYGDGTFRPLQLINRAEFTKMIVEGVVGETPDEYVYANCFSDVNSEWYAKYVCQAKEWNWVEGYGSGEFKPDDDITRSEAIKIMREAFKWELLNEQGSSRFYDNQDSSAWFWDDLMSFEERGLLDTLDAFISPHELISRKQMSTLLYRAMKFEEGEVVDNWSYEYDTDVGYQEILDLGLAPAIPPETTFPSHSQSGWPYGCYSFATKNLVEYKYGEILDIAAVQAAIGWDGTFIWDDAESSNFAALYNYDIVFSYDGSAEFFLKKLAMGEPLVLYIPYYSGDVNIGHQVVAYSFDADGVWVADSAQGLQRRIPYTDVFLDGANSTTNLTEYRKVKAGGEEKLQAYFY
ncbi:MAG: S-layer homology domain-containing protein [Candidatus Gracilibacteria bacterium]